MERLVGAEGLRTLAASHVLLIGLGGVGSFAAEAIARAGVGTITLVDFDRVCVTNTNRQLQALQSQLGRPKAEVLAERLAQINPEAKLTALVASYSAESAESFFAREPDCIIDAIDNISAKCHLLAECRRRGVPVVSSLGAGGRTDIEQLRCADLASAKMDPMGSAVRKILRQKHGLPRSGKLGIRCVYSLESPREPAAVYLDEAAPPGEAGVLASAEGTSTSGRRKMVYGTAAWLTGSFGLACAGEAVKLLLSAAPAATGTTGITP